MIEERLSVSQFGIIVVTAENMEKTWLNFEAGALSNRFGDNAVARVVPVMTDFDSVYQIQGPIAQFQAVKLDKTGMKALVESLCNVISAEWQSVEERFEWSWEQFEAEVADARARVGKQPEAPPVDLTKLVVQMLDLLKRQQAPQQQARSAYVYGHPLEHDKTESRILQVLSEHRVGLASLERNPTGRWSLVFATPIRADVSTNLSAALQASLGLNTVVLSSVTTPEGEMTTSIDVINPLERD